ncbi:MAG: hypothetical protein SFU91_06090 [Chloroherpetonaceae bacterium]|nr:hypothetical protein [Chloroherpetonaceae bacterium]
MSKRVLAVMAIGKKYQSHLKKSEFMFQWYAKRCQAEFVVIDKPLDPKMKHNLLMQKMLFASFVSNADEAVLLDLDMLISPKAKNIFEIIHHDAHLYACIDPYGTDRFKKTAQRLWKKENIQDITHPQYFENAGLKDLINPQDFFALNGGAYLLKPKLVGESLQNLYHTCTEKYSLTPLALRHEECMMAFYSQSSKIFQSLPQTFNYQIIFDLFGTPLFHEIPGLIDTLYRKIMRRVVVFSELKKNFIPRSYQFHPKYLQYISSRLESESILHFAGGYVIPDQFLQPSLYPNLPE